jgi:GNAT superfamily N-acetyltransferase
MRQVAVLPPLQGGGIGGALVRFAESFAVSHGIVRFELSARETAVPFYLNLGYEMVGEPYEEVTLPHRSLVKNLS